MLAKLSSDSDAVISALARKRENIADFINTSNTRRRRPPSAAPTSSAASRSSRASSRAAIDDGSSSTRSRRAATPVFTDLGNAAPSLTRATKALAPFADAGVPALTSLGDAADTAGPDLVASDPVIRQVRGLASPASARRDGPRRSC